MSKKTADKPALEMTGAEMVIQALADQGIKHIFGYPGGAVLPIYDEIFQQSDVQHILVRHEQGATHMADGYARASGKVGVALATSGPGATNLVTGIATAPFMTATVLNGATVLLIPVFLVLARRCARS